MKKVHEEYDKLRKMHANKQSENKFISLAEARRNKFSTDWKGIKITKPSFLGNKAYKNYPLEEIAKYIDWTPFFHAWEMKGSYPKIFSDPERGTEAKKLFDDAQAMLKKVIDGKWLTANAVVGFYPANTINDDDIEIIRRRYPEKCKNCFAYLSPANQKA